MIDLQVAQVSFRVMQDANDRMDAELAGAKNKRGAYMKYLHVVPPKAMSADPWDFEASKESGPWWASVIAIGMLMHERLQAFAKENGIK